MYRGCIVVLVPKVVNFWPASGGPLWVQVVPYNSCNYNNQNEPILIQEKTDQLKNGCSSREWVTTNDQDGYRKRHEEVKVSDLM